jgi:cytochrome P450
VIMEDPPVHTRLRRLMNHWFLPNRIEAWRPRIHEVVDGLLDDMAAASAAAPERPVDLMAALAVPLPVTIVGDLLGIPDEQRPNLRRWGDAVFGGTPDRAQDALVRLHGMVSDLVAARKADPKGDATSYWLTTTEADGSRLDEHEVVGMAYFIILGGFDSTAGMIANSVLTLLCEPDLMAHLRANPDEIPGAIEELMRHAGSLQTAIRRFATEDLDLAGRRISAGDTVLLSLGAANRCPTRFADPEALDFTRPRSEHVVFGNGPHICPGADLARIEISVAISSLLRRFPRLALAVPADRIAWRSSHVVRAPVELPVTFR